MTKVELEASTVRNLIRASHTEYEQIKTEIKNQTFSGQGARSLRQDRRALEDTLEKAQDALHEAGEEL